MYKAVMLNIYNSIHRLFVIYKSMFRFAVVGSINTGVDFMTFTILYSFFGVDKFICQTAGYSLGIFYYTIETL